MNFAEKNYETILITPELGKDILSNHNNYRRLNAKRVRVYMDSMVNGGWRLSQPILFDENGKLCDGQHRIQAVIDSGIPQWFIIICGIPSESISSLDNGQPRTANQVLMFERSDAYSRAAQIVRAIKLMPNHKFQVLLNSELPELWDKYYEYVSFVCTLIPTKQKGFSKSGFNAALARSLMCNPSKREKIETLVREAMSGDFNKSINSGSLMKLLLSSGNTGTNDISDLYLKSSRVIKAEIDGVRISKIYTPTEDLFPLPERFQ